MTRTDSFASPLEAAAGVAGPRMVKSFRLLGDEIRLAILLALWEAHDPHAEDNAVTFSELHDRVGDLDSGHFSYHLDKLLGHFVDKKIDGYELRNAGLKIVRAVIAGSGLQESSFSETEIPRSCYHCGASVKLSYEDGRLYQICTECAGNIGSRSTENAPRGTLIVYDDFNPAGLTRRTPGEVFVAGTIEYEQSVRLRIRGVCPECSGLIEDSLHVCTDHEIAPEGLCPACGTVNEARVSYVCSVCKHGGTYPAWMAVYDHPALVAFYYEHGFDMTFGLDDPEDCGRLWQHLKKEQTLVSADPVRIRVTASINGAELTLVLDEDLEAVEIVENGGDGPLEPVETESRPVKSPASRERPTDGSEGVDRVSLPDKAHCLRELRRRRWPYGVVCPTCSSSDVIKKGTTGRGAQRYKCHGCERKFNDLTGTVFADRNLTLPEMAHIIREKDRTEVTRIARELDRSYKSVLSFAHDASAGGEAGAEYIPRTGPPTTGDVS